jgi:ADP-ribosylglycohydrolase
VADETPAASGAALRLRCLAAFRLGELDEAAELALLDGFVTHAEGDRPVGACVATAAAAGRDRQLAEAHEISVRIRYPSQLERVPSAHGDALRALEHLEHARCLAERRQYRQARAHWQFLRTRAEREHLYR